MGAVRPPRSTWTGKRLRYTVYAVPEGPLPEPQDVAEVARAIERAGFDAAFISDHPFPRAEAEDGGSHRNAHHTWDLFTMLGFLAGETSTVRLQAGVCVLPYRNPFLVGSAANTVDHLSRGRLILGVSSGYHEPEFAALGADFASRGRLTDEALEALEAAWSGQPLHASGTGWLAAGNSLTAPLPGRTRPPIWIGGNSLSAMTRAVAGGYTWMPFGVSGKWADATATRPIASHEDLRRRVRRLRALEDSRGSMQPVEVCFIRGALDWRTDEPDQAVFEGVAELSEMGVGWCGLRLGGGSLEEMIDRIGVWGEALVSPHRDDEHVADDPALGRARAEGETWIR